MLVSIVGTRPNLVKLAPIVKAAKNHKIKHHIIHTGQHYDYEMSQIFFEQLEIPMPDNYLEVGSGSDAYQIGETIKKTGLALSDIPKDSVILVYGDTNATVGGALGAKKSGFFVGHIESGVRTNDFRFPEELNRLLAETSSDILFCPTQISFNNVKTTGRAHLVGDVMYDTFLWAEPKLGNEVTKRLRIEAANYYLLTLHRAINVDNIEMLKLLLSSLTDLDAPLVFPAHPRTKKALKRISVPDSIKVLDPLGYFDFLSLLKSAKKVLTDSGGVQKEAYVLGVPCITLLDTQIWPETINAGWNFMAGSDMNKIRQAIHNFNPEGKRPTVFGDGKAANKIVEILNKQFSSV